MRRDSCWRWTGAPPREPADSPLRQSRGAQPGDPLGAPHRGCLGAPAGALPHRARRRRCEHHRLVGARCVGPSPRCRALWHRPDRGAADLEIGLPQPLLLQDDFHFMELGLGHSFTWSYLSQVAAGHWFPGVYAISWVVARAGLYDWGFASTITVVMLAAANLAALRLLRTLFGDRPAILVPLLIYLLCPLSVMDIRFWAAAIELWPLVIAIFMALTAQVHYVRTRRFRHAVAAAAWLAVGLIFNEKALVLPLLLFAITSAFLMEGPWRRTIRECLVKVWRAWLLQAVLLACYATALVWSLGKSPAKPSVPGTASAVLSFTEELVKDTFVPGAIGGPWQWSGSPDAQMASAATPNALAWLAVIVAVAVILASIVPRLYAWRSWAILAGWGLPAAGAPLLLRPPREITPRLLPPPPP